MGRIRTTLHGSQLRNARLSLEEKAALAQKYGYPGLDFSLAEAEGVGGGDTGAVADLFARHGVVPSTVGGVLAGNLLAPEADFGPALEAVPERARRAAALGATRTVTVLFNRATEPKETLWPLAVERVRRLDQALDGTGVRLGVEFLGVRTLHPERPYAFVQSMAEANRLLDDAGARQVGLTLDSYHWYAGGDTTETIRQTPGERIVLLHVNDARPGPREALLDADRLVPGEGVIPLAGWLQAIDATGFDGFVGLEVLGPRLAEASADEHARIGIEAIAKVAEQAGVSLR
jgi:sugar phosphate isomerase/epimerase